MPVGAVLGSEAHLSSPINFATLSLIDDICVSNNGSAIKLDTPLLKRCICCACMAAQHSRQYIVASKSMAMNMVLDFERVFHPVPSTNLLGGLPNEKF